MLALRSRSFRLLLGPALVLMVAFGWSRSAHADQVERLIGQLRSASDYKVRLSAALNLAKIGDGRAIPVFIKALRDSDKTVRGVAAAGLGKLVNAGTSSGLRRAALDGLRAVASRDDNGFVRKQAQKAYDMIRRLGSGGGGSVAAGSTYVNIGSMSAKTSNARRVRELMRETVQKTFRAKASSMVIDWPGGRDPSGAQIKARRVHAFHVDGTVNEIRSSGGTVECKVSMLLATYPDKSMFGFLKGGARVEAGSSASEVAAASEDCVSAVVEDLIARKIIPTIEARTP